MNFRVLIVGSGAQGKVMSANMARASEVDEIRLSDVDLEACKRHVDWLESDKVTAHLVDASDSAKVASLAKGVDVLVNAVIPEFNLSLMDAALDSGAHYIDLAFGPPYENIDKELEKSDQFKDAGLTAITGHGTAPGLTNILAANAADKLSRVETVLVRLYNTLEAKELVSTWSPKTLIEDCMLEPVIFENGEFKKVPPFSAEETYTYPDPAVGTQTVWSHMHEEPFMLGRSLKSKGLRNCNVKMGALGKIKSLFDLALLSDKPLTIKDATVKPWEVVAASLPPTPTLEELKEKIEKGIITGSRALAVVDVTGEKNGQRERHVLWAPYPNVNEVVKTYPMATHTSYMAGTNGAVLARMLGRGDIKTKGVVLPELLEPETRQKYLQELAAQDPPILAYERVERRIN